MDNQTVLQGMLQLSHIDRDVKEAFTELGMPEVRLRQRGFDAFLFTIISQQLSTKAATTIMGRALGLMEETTPVSSPTKAR